MPPSTPAYQRAQRHSPAHFASLVQCGHIRCCEASLCPWFSRHGRVNEFEGRTATLSALLYPVPVRQRAGFLLQEMSVHARRGFDLTPLADTLSHRARVVDYDDCLDRTGAPRSPCCRSTNRRYVAEGADSDRLPP